MSTVDFWVRINPAATNAAAFRRNESVPAIVPLIIRLHPANPGEVIEQVALPYNPIQVRYGNLADEITQIARPATTPIVAFRQHRLMSIDFTFVMAQPGDGLATSMDEVLQILRKFAASGHRVISMVNFDSLTHSPYKYRNLSPESRADGLFFHISDMSIESTRRNKNNQISQANVTMSLIEVRNPKVTVASIPVLNDRTENINCKPNQRRVDGRCVPKRGQSTPPTQPQDNYIVASTEQAARILANWSNASQYCCFVYTATGGLVDRRFATQSDFNAGFTKVKQCYTAPNVKCR